MIIIMSTVGCAIASSAFVFRKLTFLSGISHLEWLPWYPIALFALAIVVLGSVVRKILKKR